MEENIDLTRSLAAEITKSASRQTYYTIRFLADRQYANDAYLAYAYFRWVDDILDAKIDIGNELCEFHSTKKVSFLNRQKDLLEACYLGKPPDISCIEEQMLVDLINHDTGKDSGLQSYLRNMMGVMEFDVNRRGRLISQAELAAYTNMLAMSVTDALYYFIGHEEPPPPLDKRYLAVSAAHITHMLRDMQEDIDNHYFNIPGEYLQAHRITRWDLTSQAYRDWVCSRVGLAQRYFKSGRESLALVKNLRRRLAGYAYIARFEWMLHVIERDNYCLRSEYSERNSLKASLWMSWTILISIFTPVQVE